ncbi:MAG: hypothetical protein JO135_01990 [Candidatus Eremiobacteraeota bacterium]|nr:hypothetical protein [Candidatus Eremiobacteraeota bacterium]
MLSAQTGSSVVAAGDVGEERVTLRVQQMRFEEILRRLSNLYRLQIARKGGVFLLTRAGQPEPHIIGARKQPPLPRDRRLPAVVITSLVPEAAAPKDESISVRMIALEHAAASTTIEALHDVLPPATYIPDDRHKTIMIVSRAGNIAAASQLLRSVDVPGDRVVIHVRLVDVRLVEGENNMGQELRDSNVSTAEPGMYAFARDSGQLDRALKFLIDVGRAQSLADRQAVSKLRQSVDFSVGPQYAVVNESPRTNVRIFNLGAQLLIQTELQGEGLSTQALMAYAVPERLRGGALIATRQAAFSLRLKAQQSIVVGGLFKEVDSAAIAAAPMLVRLPDLGPLFAARRNAHIKDEACFIITPRVVHTADLNAPLHREKGQVRAVRQR